MMSNGPRWLGSGSLGAVYDVDLGGTRVAVKKFFESNVSSSAFQREAVLLAELRHPVCGPKTPEARARREARSVCSSRQVCACA